MNNNSYNEKTELMQENNSKPNHRIACVSVFFCVLLIFLWRMPTRLFNGFLWAEDITIFMKHAYETGVRSITTPYAGYFHFLPRIIAYLQTWKSTPLNAPYFYMWSSVVICAIGSAYIFHVATRYIRNFILSALTAFAPFYVIHSGEVFCNITNLQWVLAPSLFALFFDLFMLPQRSTSIISAKTIVLLVLGLTGPFSLIFSPIVLLILFLKRKEVRSRRIYVPASVFFASVVIQAWATANFLSKSSALKSHLWFDRFLLDYSAQIFLTRQIISLLEGKLVFWVFPVLLLISIFVSGRKSFIPIMLFSYSIGLWVIGVIRINAPEIITSPLGAGARYYFVPYLFLAWGLIICIKESNYILKPIPSLLLTCIVFTGMTGFNAEVHKTPSIIQTQNGVYEITAPPEWHATIYLKN